MIRNHKELKIKTFDVLIIGGGITGSCLAHDAALRGFKVALIEKADFGNYTSSASSKLIHGGIRYLPKFQFLKVRESAKERAIFQNIAPHLTYYISFVVPTFDKSLMKGKFALKMALGFHTIACSGLNRMIRDIKKKVPSGHFYTYNGIIEKFPEIRSLNGLNGGQVFFESHMMSSERMTLAFLKTAYHNGAKISNYLYAEGFIEEYGRVTGVKARDRFNGETFEIKAKVTANATGPFIPVLNLKLNRLHLKKDITGFSKGIHIVTRQINKDHAIALVTTRKTEGFFGRGGRHFFIIPWRDHSLIGTMNFPFNNEDDKVKITKDEITEFLENINQALPDLHLTQSDIRYAFAGLYPLTAKILKPDTYQGTGEYQIVDHSSLDGIEGIVTVLGAKFTTARKVSKKAADLIAKKLGVPTKGCRTHVEPLLEGKIFDLNQFIQEKKEMYGASVESEIIENLISHYGTGIDLLMRHISQNDTLGKKLCPDRKTLEVEVWYAVKHEMAITLEDVIFRRTGLGTIGHPGERAITRSAEIMAELLHWDKDRFICEVKKVNDQFCLFNN